MGGQKIVCGTPGCGRWLGTKDEQTAITSGCIRIFCPRCKQYTEIRPEPERKTA